MSEGITNFASLLDFDKKSIYYLLGTCKESIPDIEAYSLNKVVAKPSVNEANTSKSSVRRLVVVCNTAKFYDAVRRIMTPQSIHYGNVLYDFKVEWDAYEDLRTQDDPKVPKVNDKDQDRKSSSGLLYSYIAFPLLMSIAVFCVMSSVIITKSLVRTRTRFS